jgi:CheY-like chemotaxis protein
LRILVAEDNVTNQQVALRMLERLGFEADVAATGLEVLARLDEVAYDVVLMDVQMPEMDGLEASRAIGARWPADERPRIIAMTAEAMEGDREACLAAGMDDYIAKPVKREQLERALAECRPLLHRRVAGSPTSDVLDRSVLGQLEVDLGGPAALHGVIMTFLDATPRLLATLRNAAAAGDPPGVRRAAHTLKASSAMLGAGALSARGEALERLSRAGDVQGAPADVAAIEVLYGAVSRALEAEAGEARRRSSR